MSDEPTDQPISSGEPIDPDVDVMLQALVAQVCMVHGPMRGVTALYWHLRHVIARHTSEQSGRFYIDGDDDGHEYVVPVERKREFKAAIERGEAPEWAIYINGPVNSVSFENPVIE